MRTTQLTPRSVAFKCTYNDGGEGDLVGFAGTCSIDNIRRNVKNARVWCSNSRCACRQFSDAEMKGRVPVRPCMESEIFTAWRYGAGTFHGEAKRGKIPIRNTAPGKLAILTTRFPKESEALRRIVGLFRIERIKNGNTIIAAANGRVRLPMEEAKALYFWAYCSNKAKTPNWRTGLFRYLEDGQVHRILADVADTLTDKAAKDEVDFLIADTFGTGPAPPASGCLPEKSSRRAAALAYARKYGPGGEGRDHKDLKEWILAHPEALGLSHVVDRAAEYRFMSGDAVDIMFAYRSERYTVVEIETTTPKPGAHQAIKYRALLCAQKGLPLDSPKVRSFWSLGTFPRMCGTSASDTAFVTVSKESVLSAIVIVGGPFRCVSPNRSALTVGSSPTSP